MARTALAYLSDDDERTFFELPDAGMCRSCVWWEHHEGPTYPEWIDAPGEFGDVVTRTVQTGDCHRYPPTINRVDVDDELGLGQTEHFPETTWDQWCGEHTDHS